MVVQALGAAMLATAVAELGVLLLQIRGIGQHGPAQVDGRRRCVDRSRVPIVHERRKISAVIDMGVGENYAVDTGHREWEMTVTLQRVAPASLVKTTVEKESLTCRLE